MENIKGEDYKHMMDWNDGMERGLGVCTVLFLGLLVGLVAFEQVNAGGVARVLPSGDGIKMEYQGAEGSQQDVIPLYRPGQFGISVLASALMNGGQTTPRLR